VVIVAPWRINCDAVGLRPEIKEPQQLRGKVIGINRFGGSNDAAVLMAVKAWKMDAKDISMLQTGGTSARMAALMSKKIDATVQSYPEIYQARKLGMNVLADIGDFGFHHVEYRRAPSCSKTARLKGFLRGQIKACTTSRPIDVQNSPQIFADQRH
jgi:ABC-type taurine transport system substrate-binding protein